MGESAALTRHIHDFVWRYAPANLTASEETLRSYRTTVTLYLRWLDSRGVTPATIAASHFSRREIEAWLGWLSEERGCSPRTCNARLSSLRTMLRYVSRHDPTFSTLEAEAALVAARKVPKGHVEGLTRSAVGAILAQPDQSTRTGRRDLALMVTLYATAARIGEILALKVCQLSLEGPRPHAKVIGKGGKARIVYLPDKAVAHIKAYMLEFHGESPEPGDYLFWSRNGGRSRMLSQDAVTKQLRKHALSARTACPEVPANLHAHLFRHARASHWLEDGLNLAQISLLLGHASIETTMVYLDVSLDSKEDAMRRLEGVPQKKRWGNGCSLVTACGLGGVT